jgi:hypothetical protein
VIFGGGDIDVLLARSGGDFLYADHDFNFGAPVQVLANGDVVNGGPGSDVIIALGGDTIQRDPGDFQPDVIVGQGLNLNINDFLFSQLLPPNRNNIAINLQKAVEEVRCRSSRTSNRRQNMGDAGRQGASDGRRETGRPAQPQVECSGNCGRRGFLMPAVKFKVRE